MTIPDNQARPRLFLPRTLPEPVEDRARASYRCRFARLPITASRDDFVAAAEAEAFDALLVTSGDPLGAREIAALPRSVRIIATFSVGYDHIDLAAAAARDMIVTNTPDVLSDATAEIAMLLLLAAARRAHEGERLVRSGAWTGYEATQLMGVGLSGKRLGLFGMGRIGLATGARARAFGMEIHYRNRAPLPADRAGGAHYHDNDETFLAASQFLSLHAPLTDQTSGWLNADRINRLPDGAVLVNTARGGLVEDDALIAALQTGKVRAAGLDVYAGEPALHPGYRSLDNVFLLPHLGSATLETRTAMGFRALDNLDDFFAGRTPRDRLSARLAG